MATVDDIRDAMREYAQALMESPPGHDDRWRGASLLGLLNERDRLWEALTPLAQSAHHVLNDDGTWNGRELIKDWFDYDDLERVLNVAKGSGWTPDE